MQITGGLFWVRVIDPYHSSCDSFFAFKSPCKTEDSRQTCSEAHVCMRECGRLPRASTVHRFFPLVVLCVCAGGGEAAPARVHTMKNASDAFAMMMSSQQRASAVTRQTPAKRSNPLQQLQHAPQPTRAAQPLPHLHSIEDAREEMMRMGFERGAVERALQRHTQGGARVDLAHAIASCISFSETPPTSTTPGNTHHINMRAPAADHRTAPPAAADSHSTEGALRAGAFKREAAAQQDDKHCEKKHKHALLQHAQDIAKSPREQDNNESERGAVAPEAKKAPPAAAAATAAATQGTKGGAGNLCAFLGVADTSCPPFFFLDWPARSVPVCLAVYLSGCLSFSVFVSPFCLDSFSHSTTQSYKRKFFLPSLRFSSFKILLLPLLPPRPLPPQSNPTHLIHCTKP